jgi:nucleoside-diphosphate-sugar epimerase
MKSNAPPATQSPKALVTGGAGFIGSHLVHELLRRQWEVVVLDNLATGAKENVPKSASLIVADLSNQDAMAECMNGCQYVFHLAAVSSVQDSLDRPVAVHDVNLSNTLQLLEVAVQHKVKRVVFSSSAAVYGDTGGLPAREDMIPKPLSHYAVQKLACEHYLQVYGRLHGLETVALRYFNVFGARQRADSPYSGVIARFVDAAIGGREIVIFGSGEQTRDFCAVQNVVNANISAATKDQELVAGRVFNIGTGVSVSIGELAGYICDCLRSASVIRLSEGRVGEIKHSRADISEARDVLGYEPIGFRESMQAYLGELGA